MQNGTATQPTVEDWSDFLRRAGNALSILDDHQPGDPDGIVVCDPLGAAHTYLRRPPLRELEVDGPSYTAADGVPDFMIRGPLLHPAH